MLPAELGYKDNFLVKPWEKVKIIIPFGDQKGRYVFHCHTLEHEKDGMMLHYTKLLDGRRQGVRNSSVSTILQFFTDIGKSFQGFVNVVHGVGSCGNQT